MNQTLTDSTNRTHYIHWTIFGEGEELLIALHGFGDKGGTLFEQLPSLGKRYTVYAPDLPFHGKTEWNAPTYTAQDILTLIQQAVEHSGKERFSIMGFSYGARIILGLLPELQVQLKHIFLLAPDGIQGRSGRMARLTPAWLRRGVVSLVEPPDNFYTFLRLIGAKYWLPANTYTFLTIHLSRPHRRKRTFGTWQSMTAFPVEPRMARARLRAANVATTIFLGEKDPIIPPSAGNYVAKGNPNVQLHFLDADHFLIGTALNDLLEQTL